METRRPKYALTGRGISALIPAVSVLKVISATVASRTSLVCKVCKGLAMEIHHVLVLVLALFGAASASDITVGGLMGWGMGMQYTMVNASVGDVLVWAH